MRSTIKTFTTALVLIALSLTRAALAAPPGALQLPEFDALADKAAQTVDITLDAALLSLASGFLDPAKPEDAAAKDVIRGLQGIYVRSYTFDTDFAYPQADVERVRKQLTAPGWQKLVVTRDTREHSKVDIYVCVSQGRACGLAIIASEPRQFTMVNIVGVIDLQKLHALEGKFGIPNLSLNEKK